MLLPLFTTFWSFSSFTPLCNAHGKHQFKFCVVDINCLVKTKQTKLCVRHTFKLWVNNYHYDLMLTLHKNYYHWAYPGTKMDDWNWRMEIRTASMAYPLSQKNWMRLSQNLHFFLHSHIIEMKLKELESILQDCEVFGMISVQCLWGSIMYIHRLHRWAKNSIWTIPDYTSFGCKNALYCRYSIWWHWR